eukprot:scaffold5566_cov154-Amphora_coffeaeformis.AAC.3
MAAPIQCIKGGIMIKFPNKNSTKKGNQMAKYKKHKRNKNMDKMRRLCPGGGSNCRRKMSLVTWTAHRRGAPSVMGR